MIGEVLTTLAGLGLAGWPLGVTLAAAVATDRVREARRRAGLNRALHELRRPLQVLALSTSPAEERLASTADLALAALDDLDRRVNGSALAISPRPVACRGLVEAAVERWRSQAALSRRCLELRWRAGGAMALADSCRVAQALDNLIANALEHGGLRIQVGAILCARGVRVTVSNSIPRRQPRAPRDRRRGHGLHLVSEIAAAHGGRLLVHRTAEAWTATLELPMAPLPISSAEAALAA